MANKACTIEGCPSAPRFECKCQDPPLLFCDGHILDHAAEGLTKNHAISPLFANISQDEYSFINRTIKEINKNEYIAINRMTIECSRKIDEIKEFYANKILALRENVISTIEILQNAIINRQLSQEDKLIIDLKAIEDSSKYEKKKKLLSIMNSHSGRYDFNYFFSEDIFLYSVKPNSRSLIEYDRFFNTLEEISFSKFPVNFRNDNGVCKFEDGDLFYCGGSDISYSKKYTYHYFYPDCYRIDPKTSILQILEKTPTPIAYIHPICIGNYIYIFGGSQDENKILNSAWKYSISERKWIVLADMPVASDYVSCVSIKNSILLSIANSGIWRYDFSEYEKLFDNTEYANNIGYLLKTISGRLFYLISRNIYESSEEDYKNWVKVGSYDYTSSLRIESNIKESNGVFIWMKDSNNLLCFDYRSFSLTHSRIR